MKLRLGTRGSALALARSEVVAEQLRAAGNEVEIVRVATSGVDSNHMPDGYSVVTFAKELREAHRANDRAVMRAYGFPIKMTEADCVAALMQRYEQLTAGK